jgi:hypothetical protein
METPVHSRVQIWSEASRLGLGADVLAEHPPQSIVRRHSERRHHQREDEYDDKHGNRCEALHVRLLLFE